MLRMFDYNRSSDEVVNNLVDSAIELARESYEGKKSADYAEKNTNLLNAMGKKMAEGTRYESQFEKEGLAMYKKPSVKNNSTIRDNFNAVIADVVTVIVPEVVNDQFASLIADVKQVGFGETARFIIESNDLFKVNSKAEGVRKGVDQPMFDEEITLNAHPITIDTAIDWYPFAAGIFDMGNFAAKIGRSFSAYIFLKAIMGMTKATDAFGAAYETNGVTPVLFGTLRERVSAANGGMPVIAVGTSVALSNLHLDGGNFQVQIGEEMNKVGYLAQYLGVPTIALNNVMVPGLVNGAAKLALRDDRIFLIPVGGHRPVKILFEGNEISVSCNPDQTSDRRYGISVEMRVAVSAIVSSKYGTIKL